MKLQTRQQNLLTFVQEKHGSQQRKYTREPYWNHLYRVAERVAHLGGLYVEIALGHDLLEDTPCTAGELRDFLTDNGYSPDEAKKITHHIKELTDVFVKENYPQMNRKERKRKEAERLGSISPTAQTVKYADLIDNAGSIRKHDPGFAKVYLAEKEQILNTMKQGDPELYQLCKEVTK